MFVNGLAFLVTISRDIRLRTAEYLPTRTAKAIGSSINKVKKIYSRGGYIVNCLLMDQEFDKVEPEIDDSIEVNTSGARDHCPEIERSIRTLAVAIAFTYTAGWSIGHGVHLAVALTVGTPRTWRLAIKHVPIGALKFAETLESFG